MKKFIDGLIVSAHSGATGQISVYGYCSPEGPFRKNEFLADRRGQVIAEYISRNAGIPMDEIRTVNGNADWISLRALVLNTPDMPSREAVLKILDEYLPGACSDLLVAKKCRKQLMAIDEGRVFQWMIENLFPKLRYSLATYSIPVADHSSADAMSENITMEGEGEFAPPDLEITPGIGVDDKVEQASSECKESEPEEYYIPLHRLALKTNLLYDAALLPNVEVEWFINNKWSVALEGGIAWWGKYSNNHSYRLVMVSPEVRRWFGQRDLRKGFYAGLFAGGGYYDFEKSTRGYRGEGGMVGISAGYMWPISRTLSLEAEIGAGYLYSRCKEYVPIDGCLVYQRTKDINYFGPLKAKFSFVWRLWDLNKNGRQIQQNDINMRYEK